MRLWRNRKLVASYVGGGGFSPASLPGLKLWLDAAQITGLNDGDAVTTWADLSGNGNNATQATGSKKPTWKTTYVDFDGVDDVMATAAFDPDTTGITCLVSWQWDAVANYPMLYSFSAQNEIRLYAGTDGAQGANATGSTSPNTSVTLGARQNYVFVDTGAALAFYINNVAAGTSGVSSLPGSQVLYLGGRSSAPSFPLNGRIYKMLVYDTALSPANLALLNNWLSL